jgi:hypothetical protein
MSLMDILAGERLERRRVPGPARESLANYMSGPVPIWVDVSGNRMRVWKIAKRCFAFDSGRRPIAGRAAGILLA